MTCVEKKRKIWTNSMNDDKSSMAGEVMPSTLNTELDHHSQVSWENQELHHPATHTLFQRGESGKSDGNVRGLRGIFPSLKIILAVCSHFCSGDRNSLLSSLFPLPIYPQMQHHLPS